MMQQHLQQTATMHHLPQAGHRVPDAVIPQMAKTPQLRLLLVTPRYLPYMGGVENHVYQVARRLAQAAVDVTVLTTDPSQRLPLSEEQEGVKIRRIAAYPARRDYHFAPELLTIIRQGAWDLVHVQSYHTLVAPLAMWAAWRSHLPYVVTFHGGGHSSALRNQLRGAQQRLLRPLLARAEKLVAVANFEIAYYRKQLHLPPERFVLIPNGCEIVANAPSVAPTTGTRIVSIGRLEQYKGHQRILAALPYLLPHYPDVQLRIVGEGPYKASLEAQAAALGLSDRVAIGGIPLAEREKLAATVAGATVVTLLSDYETHPIAALEALALQRPVLVTQTSGLQELAEQGFVRSIALDSSPQAIAAAVIQQIRDPLIPAQVVLPTWEACARDLLTLYQSCLEGASLGIVNR